jgi:hypothetical protein
MTKRLVFQAILLAVMALGVSTQALALSFTLNDSALHGSGPFGTIDLTQIDGDTVQLTLTLAPGVLGLVDTGNAPPGNHPTIAWNLAGAPAGVTVDVIDDAGDGWNFYDVHAAPVAMSDNFGSYMFAMYCNGIPACGSGGSDPNPGPVRFNINLAGITPASFIANSPQGTRFVADILTPDGSFLVRSIGPWHHSARAGDDVAPGPRPARCSEPDATQEVTPHVGSSPSRTGACPVRLFYCPPVPSVSPMRQSAARDASRAPR